MRKWKPITPKIRMTSTFSGFSSHRGIFKEINQYKITKEVGSGAFSRVYHALASDREIAIKVVKKSLLDNKCTLYREIKALQRITHPNIVELHEVINVETSPNLFLIMQYLEGTSLDELTEAPTAEEIWKWSRQLISALHTCHN